MNIIMARIGRNAVIEYAFCELEKYFKIIDPQSFIDARVYEKKDEYRPYRRYGDRELVNANGCVGRNCGFNASKKTRQGVL